MKEILLIRCDSLCRFSLRSPDDVDDEFCGNFFFSGNDATFLSHLSCLISYFLLFFPSRLFPLLLAIPASHSLLFLSVPVFVFKSCPSF